MQDLDGIEEIFRCYICLARVKNAQMCPSCSKMCCQSCIKRWITEQRAECPHCRASLHISQLINCRFAAEVSLELDKLRKKTQKAQAKELCTIHNAPLYYYCSTCTIAVCSDCAMFGEMHQGHKFEHLSVVYQRHVEQVRSEAIALRKRLKELTSLMHQVETNVECVTKAKEERAVELAAAVEQMQARLDIQLKNKLLTLLSYKSALVEEIEHQSSMLHELNRQLAFSPKSAFITKSGALVASLQALYRRQAGPIPHPIASDFASEVVPSYISASCTLREYSKLRAGGSVFWSSGLDTYGQTWRLKVYPNGNGVARGHYLSVFLEMTSCRGLLPLSALASSGNLGLHSAKYDYRIELVNQKFPHEKVTREFASDFEVGECWGYNRFFRLDNLLKDGYLLPDDDVLVLRFYVRPQTYYQQCKDLKAYVAYLESSRSDSRADLAVSEEIKRRNSLISSSASIDADPTPVRTVHIDQDKPEYSEPAVISEKEDISANNKEWWQSDNRAFSPPTPPHPMMAASSASTTSLPVVPPLPLTMSSLQRPAYTADHLSLTSPTTPTTISATSGGMLTSPLLSPSPSAESVPVWTTFRPTPDNGNVHASATTPRLPQRSSSSDLQDLQNDGAFTDDADGAGEGVEADNDVDTANFILSLENCSLADMAAYPASPYPAWGLDQDDEDGDEDDEEHGTTRDRGEDHDVERNSVSVRHPDHDDEDDEDEEEEEEEEGLVRQ